MVELAEKSHPGLGLRRPPAVALALALPLLIVLVWGLVMRTEIATLAVPLLGPWAGIAYGHSDCTMAHALPGWSLAVAALGVCLGVMLPLLRRRLPRWTVAAL